MRSPRNYTTKQAAEQALDIAFQYDHYGHEYNSGDVQQNDNGTWYWTLWNEEE